MKHFDAFGNPVTVNSQAFAKDLTALDVINDYINAIGGEENRYN
ncbi:MAG: hypothetical protein R2778_02240 [Saprospiraceae bacterium]